jgi:hypothetical protein
LSVLIVIGIELDRPAPFVAEHVNVTPAVSVVNVLLLHPNDDVMPDSGSVTLQLTVTLLVYQPWLPNAPDMRGTMTGSVVSILTKAMPEAISAAVSVLLKVCVGTPFTV